MKLISYEQLNSEYRDLVREHENLKRKMVRLQRDNKYNSLVTENIERMRDFNIQEKEKHSLYNQLLLANCPDIVLVFNTELVYLLGTEIGYAHLGYTSANDLIGREFGFVFARAYPPEWIEETEAICLEVIQTGVSIQKQTSFSREGNMVYINANVAPAMGLDGSCKGVVLVLHDETELTVLKEQAEQSSRAKSSFLTNMSHEIRTPLNAIKGMGDLLARTQLDATQQKYTENICNASLALVQIIDDILEYSRIDTEKTQLILKPYVPRELVEGLKQEFLGAAMVRGLTLDAVVAKDVPDTLVGDASMIRQILSQLLDNAIRYSDSGDVRLDVSAQLLRDDCAMVRFVVEDTGRGIQEREIGRLFDVFSQLDVIRNQPREGTGLGLPLARRLVELMDGSIDVQSEYGKGSTFTVEIAQGLEMPEGQGREIGKFSLRDTVILVVDDIQMNIDLCGAILELFGANTEAALGGEAALQMVEQKKYDLIFMDHMMPDIDGLETTKRIREGHSINRATPIVALTANAITGMREMFLAGGMNEFLPKPIDIDEIGRLLLRYIDPEKVAFI